MFAPAGTRRCSRAWSSTRATLPHGPTCAVMRTAPSRWCARAVCVALHVRGRSDARRGLQDVRRALLAAAKAQQDVTAAADASAVDMSIRAATAVEAAAKARKEAESAEIEVIARARGRAVNQHQEINQAETSVRARAQAAAAAAVAATTAERLQEAVQGAKDADAALKAAQAMSDVRGRAHTRQAARVANQLPLHAEHRARHHAAQRALRPARGTREAARAPQARHAHVSSRPCPTGSTQAPRSEPRQRAPA